jgi:hypothetical protein
MTRCVLCERERLRESDSERERKRESEKDIQREKETERERKTYREKEYPSQMVVMVWAMKIGKRVLASLGGEAECRRVLRAETKH